MSIVKSYSVGNGETFYINHNSDSFSVIDCLSDDNKTPIVRDIKNARSGKGITRFLWNTPMKTTSWSSSNSAGDIVFEWGDARTGRNVRG
jgi:hypothetical protein